MKRFMFTVFYKFMNNFQINLVFKYTISFLATFNNHTCFSSHPISDPDGNAYDCGKSGLLLFDTVCCFTL